MPEDSNKTNKRFLTQEEASEIFMKYYGFVRAIAFEKAPSKSLIDDITHDSYICFVEKSATWHYDETKVEALLRSITEKMAHRTWHTWLRNQPEKLREIAEYIKAVPTDGVDFPGALKNQDDKLSFLKGCLAKLTAKQLAMVDAVYLSGEGYSEILKELGKNRNAAYQEVSRIRGFLAECIEAMMKMEVDS